MRRQRGRTRVSSKNQVTLPVEALTASHIRPGDELRVEADGDGRLVLLRARDPWDELVGSGPGLSAATDLAALRDEWQS